MLVITLQRTVAGLGGAGCAVVARRTTRARPGQWVVIEEGGAQARIERYCGQRYAAAVTEVLENPALQEGAIPEAV